MRFPFMEEFTVIGDYMQSAGYGYLSTPVKSPATASEVVFTRFGLSSPSDGFNKGWIFGMTGLSEARYARAFCTGSLAFDNSTGMNRLILTNEDVLATFSVYKELPVWFPVANYIIYENIDVDETRIVLNEYLTTHPEIVDSLCQLIPDCNNADTYLEKFFNAEAVQGIPVKAGTTIAMAGLGTLHDRELSIFMQKVLDENLYIDPAIYPLHLEEYFLDLAGHSLYEDFTDSFGPMLANGTVRFVQSGGGFIGTFESPLTPAMDFTTAVAASQEYDTIVALDAAWYTQDELVIDHPLSITSLNPGRVDVRGTPSNNTFDLPALPAIMGLRRGILVSQVDGYVSIANLIVHNYQATGEAEPFLTGPGIFIYRSDKVYVYNCCSVNNSVTIDTSLGEYECNGGGVNCYYCSPYIFRNFISGNQAKYGGGIFVGPFGYPVIKENVVTRNTARLDGGGICFNTASANFFLPDAGMMSYGFDEEQVEIARQSRTLLIKNTIGNNTAGDDGGGVYLSVMAKAAFRENQISGNIAWNAGGGVRATLGSDMEMDGDQIVSNQSNYFYKTDTDPQETIELNMNGGGGIAVRNSDLIMKNVLVSNNTAHGFAGGGIYFNAGREGPFPDAGWVFTWGSGYDDFDDILRNLYMKQKVLLTLDDEVKVIGNICTKFDTVIGDFRKGGGIYILRYGDDSFTALPMEVQIGRFDEIVGNTLDKISTVGNNSMVSGVIQDTGTIGSPFSNEFYLEDAVDWGIFDSSTVPDLVDGDGAFVYPPPYSP
jgi:hypothetical protein